MRALSDTWHWTGVRWEQVPLANPPSDAENHNALMSTADGVMLLMQVKDSTRCPPSGRWQRAQAKLFELRETAWTALTSDGPCVSGSAPGAPWPSETWQWRTATWQRVESMPTSRRAARAAYDPVRRRVVFFGGDDAGGMLGDTWEWDGQRWSQVAIR
jgi:hypothetical protein